MRSRLAFRCISFVSFPGRSATSQFGGKLSDKLKRVVSFRRDLFDNEIASCFYPGTSALLAANLQIELDVQEKNAFGFLLESRALNLPFDYNSRGGARFGALP
jgi:hypothetical protein